MQEADRVVGAVMQMPNPKVQRQVNDTKEKLPIHAKTITPIRTLKVQRQKVEGEEEFFKKNCRQKSYRVMFLKSLPGSNQAFMDWKEAVSLYRNPYGITMNRVLAMTSGRSVSTMTGQRQRMR